MAANLLQYTYCSTEKLSIAINRHTADIQRVFSLSTVFNRINHTYFFEDSYLTPPCATDENAFFAGGATVCQ